MFMYLSFFFLGEDSMHVLYMRIARLCRARGTTSTSAFFTIGYDKSGTEITPDRRTEATVQGMRISDKYPTTHKYPILGIHVT